MKYWLVNRDPYNGLLPSPKKLGSIIPCITQPTRVFFVAYVTKVSSLTKRSPASGFTPLKFSMGLESMIHFLSGRLGLFSGRECPQNPVVICSFLHPRKLTAGSPKNTPLEKEKHRPKPPIFGLVFGGVGDEIQSPAI